MKKGELQWAGFYLAGLLCLVLIAVKLTLAFLPPSHIESARIAADNRSAPT